MCCELGWRVCGRWDWKWWKGVCSRECGCYPFTSTVIALQGWLWCLLALSVLISPLASEHLLIKDILTCQQQPPSRLWAWSSKEPKTPFSVTLPSLFALLLLYSAIQPVSYKLKKKNPLDVSNLNDMIFTFLTLSSAGECSAVHGPILQQHKPSMKGHLTSSSSLYASCQLLCMYARK